MKRFLRRPKRATHTMKEFTKGPARVRPTATFRSLGDRTQYRLWTDGSWRRDPAKIKGKAHVKAVKRQRQLAAR